MKLLILFSIFIIIQQTVDCLDEIPKEQDKVFELTNELGSVVKRKMPKLAKYGGRADKKILKSKAFKKAWKKFKKIFNKSYDTPDNEEQHKKNLLNNVKIMNQHNDAFGENKYEFKVSINQYADQSFDEYVKNNQLDTEAAKENATKFIAQMFKKKFDVDKIQKNPAYETEILKNGDFTDAWNIMRPPSTKFKSKTDENEKKKDFLKSVMKSIDSPMSDSKNQFSHIIEDVLKSKKLKKI